MHVILKFSGIWTLYNAQSKTTKPLLPHQIEMIATMCSDALHDDVIFDALQIEPISPNKLQQLTASPSSKTNTKKKSAAYVILKFSGIWTLYNAQSKTTKPLVSQQIEMIQEMCADDLQDDVIFDALKIEPISPNKLQQLTTAAEPKTKPKTKNAP